MFRQFPALEIKPSRLGSRIRDVEAFWYETEIKNFKVRVNHTNGHNQRTKLAVRLRIVDMKMEASSFDLCKFVVTWLFFVVTNFCDEFDNEFLWQIFVTDFLRRIFCDKVLWRILVANSCAEFLWQIFVKNFCDKFFNELLLWNFWQIFLNYNLFTIASFTKINLQG